MPENHFGPAVAARYDDTTDPRFGAEVVGATVDVLAGLAGDGAALEFAVGTGRIALPLAGRGVPVSGIEFSMAMVDRLRAKDGGDTIDVTIGDMATTSHHFVAADGDVHETRTPFRYVWPSELDLMARLAGMTLRSRWADWDRSAFTGESPSHVSVWETPSAR